MNTENQDIKYKELTGGPKPEVNHKVFDDFRK